MRKSSGKGASKGRGKAASKGKGANDGSERSDHTLHLYPIDEVLSALQKAVRRGHAINAAFWAGELHVSGLTETAMKRLHIMTVEDVGIASPYAPFIAAAARARILLEQSQTSARLGAGQSELPQGLVMVCGLARWVASLPKTRTSNMLSGFLRAKTEEMEKIDQTPLGPCSVERFGVAMSAFYNKCAENEVDDETFLRMEADVFLQAYAFQLCQVNEAASLEPLFDELGRQMLSEEQRLKWIMQSESSNDKVSGFAAVRKMVMDLQHMSVGLLDSAARMVWSQSILLATRAHHLVREGVIIVPSATDSERTNVGQIHVGIPPLCSEDLATECAHCNRWRLDGRALGRCNTRILSRFARGSKASGSPMSLNLEACVSNLIQNTCLRLVPKEIFKCLLLPAEDACARYLCIPPYCTDIHTRRGSGYPMHRDWETRIVPQNPALQDWAQDEVKKTHGELDAQGRRMASQFSRFGLVVSDEYFPGPSLPNFDMKLRPDDFEHFQAVVLPVATLDHGESFVDRRSFPSGYGESWEDSSSARAECRALASREGKSYSETMAIAQTQLCSSGLYCECETWDYYKNPATPHDPFFRAAKTFMTWASENSFPSPADFPQGRLPSILESQKTSTINDNPEGKKVTHIEHFMELIDKPINGADEVRNTPIDSRPSAVTELHRARMHELLHTSAQSANQSILMGPPVESRLKGKSVWQGPQKKGNLAKMSTGLDSGSNHLVDQMEPQNSEHRSNVQNSAPDERQPSGSSVEQSSTKDAIARRTRWGKK